MTHTPNSAEQLSEKLEAFAYAYHDWQDWIVNGYGNDYDQVFNEKQATYERLRGELLAEATPPAAAPAPAVPDDVSDLLCSVTDNLGDMPVSEEWAARTSKAAYGLLVKYGVLDATPAAPSQEPLTLTDRQFDMICQAIDKADTISMDADYMLDSDDCIKVVRVMQALFDIGALREKEGSK